MIDVGSTGSRIHVYKSNNCSPSPEHDYEAFKRTRPAVRVVPNTMHGCTLVAVKATAVLCLLPGSQGADISEAVERRIRSSYPFQVQEKDGVVEKTRACTHGLRRITSWEPSKPPHRLIHPPTPSSTS
ncbi:uncharacterized protein LACBIDRAFT_314646 [Laccaria bicolor S238N-H82]|uniref:Predicted protein n=1 Tax=Laccaria bicolor (strain S238N-H82 / ATCC MYA-4686) TaxID=486041 RepID=B0DYY6_LACBS|nr:uncharacterized protein LACBIDRAFT_314646 [Laccaria bicolor S238N-H82]EDR00227.1 predicted protein [Laccaria bicolor S238N-H82]|eukprot:XP_001889136.1 predicted protein [Laccaria bicolor S238N-H82]